LLLLLAAVTTAVAVVTVTVPNKVVFALAVTALVVAPALCSC
jgi:hypothetical protein